ncbi:DUF6250 domain-containing protein [Allotamlana fucoidanivorans]|nr:DUF6250 domain-containing protein [Tamlana fucoidanivorans]
MLYIYFLTFILQISCISSKKNSIQNNSHLIYQDNFDKGLGNWFLEYSHGKIFINDSKKLEIDVNEGASIWYKEKLTGNYTIEYEATVIQHDIKKDRVSDLNCFWKAKDPNNPENLFSKARNGNFNEYNSLELYYAGIGVHNNTRTRFRRYDGTGNKPLLPEHDLYDEIYLLKPNEINDIKIIVRDNRVKFYRNERLIYDFLDKNPIKDGWFAFRTYKSHLEIDNFKIYKRHYPVKSVLLLDVNWLVILFLVFTYPKYHYIMCINFCTYILSFFFNIFMKP